MPRVLAPLLRGSLLCYGYRLPCYGVFESIASPESIQDIFYGFSFEAGRKDFVVQRLVFY